MLDAVEANDDGAWAKLHAVDQLRQEQSAGRALFEFVETPPRFAPTFKRIKVGSLLLAAAARLAAAGGPASGGTPGGCSFWAAGGADGTEAGEAVEAGKNAFEAAARVAEASLNGGRRRREGGGGGGGEAEEPPLVCDGRSERRRRRRRRRHARRAARAPRVRQGGAERRARRGRPRPDHRPRAARRPQRRRRHRLLLGQRDGAVVARVVGTNEDVLVRPACIVPISSATLSAPRLSAIASSIGESEDGGGGDDEAAVQPSRPVHPAAALVRAATRSVASLSAALDAPTTLDDVPARRQRGGASPRPPGRRAHPCPFGKRSAARAAAAIARPPSDRRPSSAGAAGRRSGGCRARRRLRASRPRPLATAAPFPTPAAATAAAAAAAALPTTSRIPTRSRKASARSLYPSMYVADEREGGARRAVKLKYNAQRIPAWCDRVLVRSWNDSLLTLSEPLEPLVDSSDHTPVFASFNVSVLLPTDNEADNESVHRHQWELTVFSAEVAVPLASLDEEDAAQARVAAPEITVEFYGAFVRTGYATRRLLAKLRADGDGGGAEIGVAPGAGPTLTAGWASQMELPVVDLYQQHGVPMMALTTSSSRSSPSLARDASSWARASSRPRRSSAMRSVR